MNQESYDAIATRWDEIRTQLSGAERRIFEMLLEGVSAGANVLDLGCGTGRPVAEYLASRGLHVTGVDQSAGMLDLARKHLPEHSWLLAALEDFEPNGVFAAVVVWDSLFHIARAAHASILGRAMSVMPAGARIALTVGGSSTDSGFTDTMFDRTFFYDSHPPEVTLALLEQLGFKILHSELLNAPTSGRDKGRLAIVASVPGPAELNRQGTRAAESNY